MPSWRVEAKTPVFYSNVQKWYEDKNTPLFPGLTEISMQKQWNFQVEKLGCKNQCNKLVQDSKGIYKKKYSNKGLIPLGPHFWSLFLWFWEKCDVRCQTLAVPFKNRLRPFIDSFMTFLDFGPFKIKNAFIKYSKQVLSKNGRNFLCWVYSVLNVYFGHQFCYKNIWRKL